MTKELPRAISHAKHARAERDLAFVRLGTVILSAGAFFAGVTGVGNPPVAYAIIVIASVYSAAVVAVRGRRVVTTRGWAYGSTFFDSSLIVAWIFVTGGADSPFQPLWFVSLAGISLRFDLARSVAAGFIYAIAQLGLAAAHGQLPAALPITLLHGAFTIVAAFSVGFGARLWFQEAQARAQAALGMADALVAEARFRGLLESSPDALVVVDANRGITLMNERAEATFAVRREGLIGRDAGDLMDPASRDAFSRWHETSARNADGRGSHVQPLLVRGVRGSGTFPLEIFASRLDAAEGPQLIVVMRDITERLAAEDARLNEASRMREIERLQEMDRFKTQFINTAAHELGTPLTPIKMQIHILESDASNLGERERRAVSILRRNVDRLGTLVQDVLDVARAQADRLRVDRKLVDLNRLAMEAVESFDETARARGITLRSHLAPNLVVLADEKRIVQVLFNLISNAIKFSGEGSEVSVSTARNGDDVLLIVKDTGIGIDPALQDQLFRPFSQVHDPQERTRSGSGLGLFITKSLVELHGGRVSVKSEGAGRGSTFTVSLPTKTAAPVPHVEAAVAPRALNAPQPREHKDALQNRIDELV